MRTRMKTLALLFAMALPVVFFSGCSDDDDDDNSDKGSSFNYPMEYVYGTWDLTEVQVGDRWYDVTVYPYTNFASSATFNKDGTYSGSGYFGNGSGTYVASGNTITTYVNGVEYLSYTVSSATSTSMEGVITETTSDSTLPFKAAKR